MEKGKLQRSRHASPTFHHQHLYHGYFHILLDQPQSEGSVLLHKSGLMRCKHERTSLGGRSKEGRFHRKGSVRAAELRITARNFQNVHANTNNNKPPESCCCSRAQTYGAYNTSKPFHQIVRQRLQMPVFCPTKVERSGRKM